MKKDMHSEDIDFKLYDHIKEFTIGEIAKLWCGIDIYAPIPPDKLPEAKAIGRKIIGALKSKELKSNLASPEYYIDEERRRINYEIISRDMLSHALWASVTINRNDLVKWANDNGHKPEFLFHGKEEISSRFPPDTKWEDMTWTFITNELVRVEAKGVTNKYLYSELGFTDRRSGDKPNTRWSIFIKFAEMNGEISWGSKIDDKRKNQMPAIIRDISKTLKDAFGIDNSPFHHYKKKKSYKTKFTIKDNRTIDDSELAEPEGFSVEDVENHLKGY